MHPDLLKILRCPETRQPLAFATEETLQRINTLIQSGSCLNRAGVPVTEKVEGALIREDGQQLYPIRNAIPVLLPDEGIFCQNP